MEEQLMSPTWTCAKHLMPWIWWVDHSVDKKLPGWSHSNRQLINGSNSKQGPVTSIIPSRGTLAGLRAGWTLWNSTRPRAKSRTWVRAIINTNTGWAEKWVRAALRRRTWECWWMRRYFMEKHWNLPSYKFIFLFTIMIEKLNLWNGLFLNIQLIAKCLN